MIKTTYEIEAPLWIAEIRCGDIRRSSLRRFGKPADSSATVYA